MAQPVAPAGNPGGSTSLDDLDRQRLNEMGYAQELRRGMGSFSNFAVSFSIISILTGGITTFYLALDAGGPRAVTLGWLIVGALTLAVGLAMAEVCSAYPTAGGLYYWSAKLARRNQAAWSWFTGWFNLVGQIAITASIDYGLATYVAFLISLYRSDFVPNARWILLIYAVVLAAHGALNTFRVKLVGLLSQISVYWHLVGTAIIVGSCCCSRATIAASGSCWSHGTSPVGPARSPASTSSPSGSSWPSTPSPGTTPRRT